VHTSRYRRQTHIHTHCTLEKKNIVSTSVHRSALLADFWTASILVSSTLFLSLSSPLPSRSHSLSLALSIILSLSLARARSFYLSMWRQLLAVLVASGVHEYSCGGGCGCLWSCSPVSHPSTYKCMHISRVCIHVSGVCVEGCVWEGVGV
jgi:hypothetical protein